MMLKIAFSLVILSLLGSAVADCSFYSYGNFTFLTMRNDYPNVYYCCGGYDYDTEIGEFCTECCEFPLYGVLTGLAVFLAVCCGICCICACCCLCCCNNGSKSVKVYTIQSPSQQPIYSHTPYYTAPTPAPAPVQAPQAPMYNSPPSNLSPYNPEVSYY